MRGSVWNDACLLWLPRGPRSVAGFGGTTRVKITEEK